MKSPDTKALFDEIQLHGDNRSKLQTQVNEIEKKFLVENRDYSEYDAVVGRDLDFYLWIPDLKLYFSGYLHIDDGISFQFGKFVFESEELLLDFIKQCRFKSVSISSEHKLMIDFATKHNFNC